MAQQQKRSFSSAENPGFMRDEEQAHESPFPNPPFAWWSNMADLQRDFLSKLTQAGVDSQEEVTNVTDIRPRETALQASALTQNWLHTLTECQRETTSFMTERLAKNQAFVIKAIGAPNLQQLMQMQATWLAQATQDYSAEFGKLTNILKANANKTP